MSAARISTHRTRVHERRDRRYFLQLLRWRSGCDTCGWTGEDRPAYDQALADGFEHERSTGRAIRTAVDERGRVVAR